MPTVEGLRFGYALYPLPPGRLPFRRWRWELWHGATLVAAGWRLSRPQAGRALRHGAAEFGALALDVLRIEEGEIADITAFTSSVFPAFGLPPAL